MTSCARARLFAGLGAGLVLALMLGTGPGVAQSLPAEEADAEPAESQPLWEVGVVAGGGWLPDYPAAGEGQARAIALPFAIYRGDFFRLGERGAARGILADRERLEIDIGVDAAFPLDSEDNSARRDMDSLDFLLEIGPNVTYSLLAPAGRDEFDVSLAARAVVSTDFRNWRVQGFTLNPYLTYRRNELFGQDLSAILSLSPLFGSTGINDYFYRVAPAEALPGRPAFEADPGYIGTEINVGLAWSVLDNVRVFGGVQVGYWDHAANQDSPLHREDVTLTVGGGLRWSIVTSDRRVAR